MRTFYGVETAPQAPARDPDQRVRRFLQLAVLAFWGPVSAFDGWLLWRDHSADGLQFVFWLLFKASIVFLALWFGVSIAHGLIRGRRTQEPTRRQRRLAREHIAQRP